MTEADVVLRPAPGGPRHAGGWRSRRGSAALVLTLTLAGAVASLWFVVALPPQRTAGLSSPAATALLLVGMAGLAFAAHVLARHRPGAVLATLMAGCAAAWVTSHLVLGLAVTATDRGWPGTSVLGWLSNWVWVPGHVLAMLTLLRFPTGAVPGPGWQWVERGVVAWGALTATVTALLPGPLGAEPLAPATNPLGVPALAAPLESALAVLFTLLPLLIVASAVAPVVRWRGARQRERRQLLWVAAAAVPIAVSAPLALWSRTGDLLQGLAFLLLPGAIGIAVLREQLWDLDLRRRFDRLTVVREQERDRLRHDLHDSLGPLLGAIAMRAEAGQNLLVSGRPDRVADLLGDIGRTCEDALAEVRRMIDALGPAALVDHDLGAALRRHLGQYADTFPVHLSAVGDFSTLDPRTAEAGYLIAGEAVRNAARHSGATGCEVRLVESEGALTVEVTDRGRGLAGSAPGLGRSTMSRRAEVVGGSLAIEEPPEGGLRVTARLPGAST